MLLAYVSTTKGHARGAGKAAAAAAAMASHVCTRDDERQDQATYRPGRYSAILDHLLQKEWW